MRKRRKQEEDNTASENLINLTPLIDVVFVVLISFILIAPLLEADHVSLANSTTTSDKNISKTQIVIKVAKDNTILVNNKIVNLAELTQFLKNKKRDITDKQTPQLYHDKKACFGTYQSIKNAVEVAGFEQLDVILQPN